MSKQQFIKGLGIGILLTSIILGIAYQSSKKEISKDEIVEMATELGMIFEEEQKVIESKLTDEEVIDKARELGMVFRDEVITFLPEEVTEHEVEYVEVVIERGMSAQEISELLIEKSIIKDIDIFFKKVPKLENWSQRFKAGVYQFPIGVSEEEIIESIFEKRSIRDAN